VSTDWSHLPWGPLLDGDSTAVSVTWFQPYHPSFANTRGLIDETTVSKCQGVKTKNDLLAAANMPEFSLRPPYTPPGLSVVSLPQNHLHGPIIGTRASREPKLSANVVGCCFCLYRSNGGDGRDGPHHRLGYRVGTDSAELAGTKLDTSTDSTCRLSQLCRVSENHKTVTYCNQ